MSDVLPNTDELKRRILFVPQPTKEALHAWIMEFLQLDIPDTLVDPDSTSTPMDMIWEVYEAALKSDRPDFARVLNYASRDSFKTLGAAVLEVLMVVHLRRNVAHMAAVETQAKKAQSYVKDFFNKPFIRDFVIGDNDRKKEIARYYNPRTGDNLTTKQFAALSVADKLNYEEVKNYINIVICTIQGANSEHVPFFVVDEVDVVANPKAYEEAKMIPAPYGDQLPITLLASTRKYSFGLVQKEIDNAAASGLHVRHWNIIDVTEKCPKERHRPDLPIIDVYYSKQNLRTITEEEYEALTPDAKELYEKDKAYTGCAKNCKMFAMCRGRLATKQKEADPKAKVRSMLKPVEHTQNQFKTVSVEVAKAQLLCWKPSTEGLIYPNFDRDVHMLTPAEIALKITGDEHSPDMTKAQLIALLKTREVRFVAGMDFGYTHNFAVVLGAIDGNRCFVLDVISIAELELEQQIEVCNSKILHYAPKVYADPENPQNIATFKKKGYRMSKVDKGHGSVLGGIEIVRQMLRPAAGPERLYFLKDDEGCELLAKRLAQYHWKLDAAGDPSDIPEEKDDDECDALRYLVMSVFAKSGKVTAPKEANEQQQAPVAQQPVAHGWMQGAIRDHLGEGSNETSTNAKGKKGSFFWDMG